MIGWPEGWTPLCAEVHHIGDIPGGLPFVYPIVMFLFPGESRELCAEVHNISHTLEEREASMRLILLINKRLEPRASSLGRGYAGDGVPGCTLWTRCRDGVPRVVYQDIYTQGGIYHHGRELHTPPWYTHHGREATYTTLRYTLRYKPGTYTLWYTLRYKSDTLVLAS